jgi:hypothetical protein
MRRGEIMVAITNTLFDNSGYSRRVPFSHAGTSYFWQCTATLRAEIRNVINFIHLCLWCWNENKPQWLVVTLHETTFTFLNFKRYSHRALMKCWGQTKICTNETKENIRISNLTKWFNINESVTEMLVADFWMMGNHNSANFSQHTASHTAGNLVLFGTKYTAHYFGLSLLTRCNDCKVSIIYPRPYAHDGRHVISQTQISHHKKMTASLQSLLLQNFPARKSSNKSKNKIRGTHTTL